MKIIKPRDKGKTAHTARPLKSVLRQNKSKAVAGEKPDSIDAKEVLAFFAGVAIVFALVNKLFFVPLMSVEEIVYGLTFADESITVQKIVYGCAILALSFSIIIPTVIHIVDGKKSHVIKTASLWFKNHNICTMFIVMFIYSPLIIVFFGFFEKNKDYISFVYVFISCLIMMMFIKCTILGRVLLIFTCLMVGYWCYFAIDGYKENSGDLPVVITLQEGAPIKALRCTISKEGFAVIKDSEKNQRIIHVSKIKEIAADKDASLSNAAAEAGKKSQ